MVRHLAYGLVIESELDLPSLTLAHGRCPMADIHISVVGSIPDLPSPTIHQKWWQASPTATRIEIEGVAVYLVEDGCRILISPAEGSDPAEVQLFLLGSVMGALLYQRGIFPLHGSAVETPWGAMVFAGPSGIGKSTLAAHFHQAGYRLLADDVCAITRDAHGVLQVLPAFPHLRLRTDAIGRLYGRDAPPPTSFDVDKFVLPLGEGHVSIPVPLGAVHMLADAESGDPTLALLRGFESIRLLADNLSRPHFLKGTQNHGEVLRLAAEIAALVDVFRLSRRRDAARLDALVRWLELGWKGRSRLAVPDGTKTVSFAS